MLVCGYADSRITNLREMARALLRTSAQRGTLRAALCILSPSLQSTVPLVVLHLCTVMLQVFMESCAQRHSHTQNERKCAQLRRNARSNVQAHARS